MPALLLSAAVGCWLFCTPLLFPDDPARAILAGVVGLAVLPLSALSVLVPRARAGIVAGGAVLALVNFVLPGDVGAIANFATSGWLLMFGGIAAPPRIEIIPGATLEVAAPAADAHQTEPAYRAAA